MQVNTVIYVRSFSLRVLLPTHISRQEQLLVNLLKLLLLITNSALTTAP